MASSLRSQALRIFQAAVRAAAPREAVLRHLRLIGNTLVAGRKHYRLNAFRNVHVVGAGKASARMAQAVERLLGKRISGGLINVKYGYTAKLRRIRINECGHPIPDSNGQAGAERIAEMKNRGFTEAREQLPELRRHFFDGEAEPFVPFHSL